MPAVADSCCLVNGVSAATPDTAFTAAPFPPYTKPTRFLGPQDAFTLGGNPMQASPELSIPVFNRCFPTPPYGLARPRKGHP